MATPPFKAGQLVSARQLNRTRRDAEARITPSRQISDGSGSASIVSPSGSSWYVFLGVVTRKDTGASWVEVQPITGTLPSDWDVPDAAATPYVCHVGLGAPVVGPQGSAYGSLVAVFPLNPNYGYGYSWLAIPLLSGFDFATPASSDLAPDQEVPPSA